jgi:hypothetical protein
MREASAWEAPTLISGWGPWVGPALVAALALGLRLGALLVHRHLTFDDGCYAVSTIDMRHGLLPYRDLFSSQGPLHYPLLYIGDLLTFRPLNGPRVVPVLSGIVATVGVWAIARRLGSPARSALFAGAVVASSGALLWATGPVSGDGPAVALAVCAVSVAARHRDRPASWWPPLAGGLFGAALAVKAIVFPFAIPIGWLLWGRRRVAPLAAAVATTIAVWFAAALPWGITAVWNQSIAFHFDKHANGSPLEQSGEVVGWLVQRDILLCGALLLALVAAVVLPRWRLLTVRDRDVLVIGAWAASTVLVLVFERLLLQLHLASLVPPLALLLALRPPPRRWLALALVLLVPLQALEIASVVAPSPYRGADAELIRALRTLPHDSLVISDVQGYVWQSGHSTPRMLNDNSTSRIEQHQVTTAKVAAGAALPKTCAVVIASYRFDKRLPGLRAALAQEGYSGRVFARAKELWTKRGCGASNPPTLRG